MLDAQGEVVLDGTENIAVYRQDDGVGRGPSLSQPDAIVLTLPAPLDPARIDTIDADLQLREGARTAAVSETGPNTRVFRSADDVTTVAIQSVSQGLMEVMVSDVKLGVTERPFSLLEDTPGSLLFRNKVFSAALHFSQRPSATEPDRVVVTFASNFVSNAFAEVLEEDAPDSLRFVSADATFQVNLPGFPDANADAPDVVTARFTSAVYGADNLALELKETGLNNLNFSNVEPSGSDVPPPKSAKDVSPLCIFKVRLNLPAGLLPVHRVTLKSSREEKPIELRPAPNGSYVSKPILATPEAFQSTFEDVKDLQFLLVDSTQGQASHEISVRGSPETKAQAKEPAFAGFRYDPGYKNAFKKIVKILQDDLGYAVTADETLTRVDCKNAVSKHKLWYSYTHGRVNQNHRAFGIEVGEGKGDDPFVEDTTQATLFPGGFIRDPAGPSLYLLAFPNGCGMGEDFQGRREMLLLLDPKTYLGWTAPDVHANTALKYAQDFFSKLNEKDKDTKKPVTVGQARTFADDGIPNAAALIHERPDFAREDSNAALDLTPDP